MNTRLFTGIAAAFALTLALSARAESPIGQFIAHGDHVAASGHKTDSQHFVIRIVNTAAPYQDSVECAGRDFNVVIETTSLAGGSHGEGFAFMKKPKNAGPGDCIYFGVKDLKVGVKFTMREPSKMIINKGVLTFGDVTLSDGTTCPVTLEVAGT